MSASSKKNDVLAYRKGKARWQSEKVDACKDVNSDRAAAGRATWAYRISLEKLSRIGAINLEKFPDDYARSLQFKYYELPESAKYEVKKLTKSQKAFIVFNITAAVHDSWVKTHKDNFFSFFIGEEFIYLPIELVGNFNLWIFYEGLIDVLPKLGLEGVSFEDVRREHANRRAEYLAKYNITDYRGLIRSIPRICDDYDALNNKIRTIMKEPEMAKELATQIIGETPNLFR